MDAGYSVEEMHIRQDKHSGNGKSHVARTRNSVQAQDTAAADESPVPPVINPRTPSLEIPLTQEERERRIWKATYCGKEVREVLDKRFNWGFAKAIRVGIQRGKQMAATKNV